MDFYLSLETAKQLKEWGCNLSSKYIWQWIDSVLESDLAKLSLDYDNLFLWEIQNWIFLTEYEDIREKYRINIKENTIYTEKANSYHLLEDICVRYAKEFWGDEEQEWYHTYNIMDLLQHNKKQEAEQYILDNCLFNPKNK